MFNFWNYSHIFTIWDSAPPQCSLMFEIVRICWHAFLKCSQLFTIWTRALPNCSRSHIVTYWTYFSIQCSQMFTIWIYLHNCSFILTIVQYLKLFAHSHYLNSCSSKGAARTRSGSSFVNPSLPNRKCDVTRPLP